MQAVVKTNSESNGNGQISTPGAQKPPNGSRWNLEYITTSGYYHTRKSMWRCDRATTWVVSANVGHFAYKTFRLLDTSSTPWTVRPLNVNTRKWKCVTYTVLQKNKSSAVAEMGDLGHNRHGPKRKRGAVPLSRSATNSSNTMWPARRSTSVPSGVFIHPAVWPQ